MLGSKNIESKKILGMKKILVRNFLLDGKKFGVKKIVGKKMLHQKKCWVRNPMYQTSGTPLPDSFLWVVVLVLVILVG